MLTQTHRHLEHALLPPTIAALTWLIILVLLRAVASATTDPASDYISHLLLAVPVGLFWGGLTGRSSARLLSVILFLALLALVSTALLYTGLLSASRTDPIIQCLSSMVGGIIGWLVWWAVDRKRLILNRLVASLNADSRLLMAVIVIYLLAMSIAPIDFGAGILNFSQSWQSDPPGGAFMAHVYALIKSIILWVPVGLIFEFAGLRTRLLHWVNASLLSFGLAALSQLDWLTIRDINEVACGALGIWMGIWLGQRTFPAQAQLSPGENAHSGAQAKPMPDQINALAAAAATDLNPTFPGPDALSVERESAQWIHPASTVKNVRVRGLIASRASALLVLAWTLMSLVYYPRFQLALGIGLLGYAVLLWRKPMAWLFVLPFTLPFLDLAPWTGRIFFDEFDLLILVTAAAWLWRVPQPLSMPGLTPSVRRLLIAYNIILLISLLTSLLPLQALDVNAFSSYWSPYNGLRIAKGYLGGLFIFVMLARMRPEQLLRASHLFAAGISAGLAITVVLSLRERWQYAGLLDLGDLYRITGPLSSMHTGGGHIEAYLVFALPFAWFLMQSHRKLLLKLAAAALILVTLFIITTTIARAAVLGLGLMGLVILTYSGRRLAAGQHGSFTRLLAQLVLVVLAIGVLTVGLRGEYFQQRFSQVHSDLATRVSHWSDAASMMDGSVATTLFGMGLGTFPAVYLQHNPRQVPGTYTFVEEGDNTLLRIGPGESAYLTQRVATIPNHSYLLTMNVRSASGVVKVHTPLCERHLLHSYRCAWQSLETQGDADAWQKLQATIDAGELGSGNVLLRRFVELSVYNQLPDMVIDVDNVTLVDQYGLELIRNGDFSGGVDAWFYKTYSHLPFHIKNLWISLYFEQGILGVILFTALTVAILRQLAAGLWRGDLFAATLLASLLGFSGIALFGSLFDAPRLTLLFMVALLWAAIRKKAAMELENNA